MASHPRRWVIILPILIGVATIALLKQNKQPPVQQAPVEQPRLVRVVGVPSLTTIPQAQGHGTVRPVRTWEAVSRIRGDIIEKHPLLEKGAILEAGTLLLRIDPTDYQLAIAQTQADIQAIEAQLQELETKAANARTSLKIEQRALALGEKELTRKRDLIGKGGVSRSDLEGQERALLTQQQSVQGQRNTLNLIPSQRALLEAELARQHSRLTSAERDLAHTEIRMPFTGRIADVQVEQQQYVREGEVLAAADGLERAEIEVQVPIEQFGSLIRSDKVIDILKANGEANASEFGLSAEVRLQQGTLSATWQGRVSRLSDTLDPKTRTAGVIVEVDNPYAGVRPGVRPPLLKGLFVEVILSGKPRPQSLVIPRFALHQGQIYIVTADNRLQIRPVDIELLQPEYAIIASGVSAGEQVVVSDLVPAIDGMLLKPVVDERQQLQLSELAAPLDQPQ